VATKQRRVTKMMADLERWRREAVVWLGRVHHPGDGPGAGYPCSCSAAQPQFLAFVVAGEAGVRSPGSVWHHLMLHETISISISRAFARHFQSLNPFVLSPYRQFWQCFLPA